MVVITTPVSQTLVEAWRRCREEDRIHPLIVLGALNLVFLWIHPFRVGIGRVSRLLLLLLCCHLGYDVGRYVRSRQLPRHQ